MVTEALEEELTVNEMIGVVKYLDYTNSRQSGTYLIELQEWKDDGYGEVIVSSCRDTLT